MRSPSPDQDPGRLPDAETAPKLFWALMASGQTVKRKVDGWEKLRK